MFAVTIIYKNGNVALVGFANTVEQVEAIAAEARRQFGDCIASVNAELAC